jgi:hypothetical protein
VRQVDSEDVKALLQGTGFVEFQYNVSQVSTAISR